MIFESLHSLGKHLVASFAAASRLESAGFLFLGFALLTFPAIFFFWGDRLFWKLRWIRFFFLLRKVCYEKGINFSGDGQYVDWNKKQKEMFFHSLEKKEGFEGGAGNFLSLAFGIEKLLKTALFSLPEYQGRKKMEEEEVSRILLEKNILTSFGEKKLEVIRWIRDSVIGGKAEMISPQKMSICLRLCWDFYREINLWLRENSSPKNS